MGSSHWLVQRWVLQAGRQGPWKSHGLCRGDPRFLGVHQGPGQRPLHPKRRIPRPQTWRYVVSMCSALAAGNVGGLSSKGGGCSNTPSIPTGQLGRGDDSRMTLVLDLLEISKTMF